MRSSHWDMERASCLAAILIQSKFFTLSEKHVLFFILLLDMTGI